MSTNKITLIITLVDMFGNGEITEKQARNVIAQFKGADDFDSIRNKFNSLMRKMKKELQERDS